MKLRISRSQKSGGILNQNVVFCIDARAELTPEKAADIKKYSLGKEVIYNSQRSKERMAKADANAATGTMTGIAKGFVGLAMSKLSLNITIGSLIKGQHIEAKDMEEVLDAEDALRAACERMKSYLARAATFDGGEEVIEF
jgi:hypothetical protein